MNTWSNSYSKRKNEVERLQRTNEVSFLQASLNDCSKNDTLTINPNISNKILWQSQFNISQQQTKTINQTKNVSTIHQHNLNRWL